MVWTLDNLIRMDVATFESTGRFHTSHHTTLTQGDTFHLLLIWRCHFLLDHRRIWPKVTVTTRKVLLPYYLVGTSYYYYLGKGKCAKLEVMGYGQYLQVVVFQDRGRHLIPPKVGSLLPGLCNISNRMIGIRFVSASTC